MYCYVCAESIPKGENYCRGCGSAAATLSLKRHSRLTTLGSFALGMLAFGLFALIFAIFSTDIVRFTPFGRYFVLALAGGVTLGFAIHFYSRIERRSTATGESNSIAGRTRHDLLCEPSAATFMHPSASSVAPITGKLTSPK